MSLNSHLESKTDYLRQEGTLNSSADKVCDPKFHEGDFFDPHDIVQVKYEMLRRVRVDGVSITQAVEEYGFTRPTYYQAKEKFETMGIAGLVPDKRGPRLPFKLRGDVLKFLKTQVVAGHPIGARRLSSQLRDKFNIEVHPRTIERALSVKKTIRS